MLRIQNINNQINSRFEPATDLKKRNTCFNSQLYNTKRNLQPRQKGPYQSIDKPTDVTNKLTDTNEKEIVQHRNNLLP